MLKIIGIIAGLGALAVLAVLALAASKSDTFQVQRSASMKAPPDKIFPLINSLRAMNTWNPFVEPDPNIKLAYTGPESGKGAAHTWSGNSQVGEGRIEITDASPPSRVAMKLDMLKPIEGHNTVVFTLEPKGDMTTVTWVMTGTRPFIGKVIGLVMNMDRMIGGQFEKGLAKLKTIAET
jgi:hypothetical protein